MLANLNANCRLLVTISHFILILNLHGTDYSLPELKGVTSIHDPSRIIKEKDRFWVFGTGRGIISRWSNDLITWYEGPIVFKEAPHWTLEWVPEHRGRFWAPDLIKLGGRYLLYYSVSTWGSRQSAIGLAVNQTLNTEASNYKWEDLGAVIKTTSKDDFNAIDPYPFLDEHGTLWLVFGSYWSGIKLIELDSTTGLRKSTNSTIYSLAWNESIEAGALFYKQGFYYLFVNWGQCCKGTNSTYEIRVGRATKIIGPYVDREGKEMLKGGGSLLLSSISPYIGPGHPAFFEHNGKLWMSYHYYDSRSMGRPSLDIIPIEWDENGWPYVRKRIGTSK